MSLIMIGSFHLDQQTDGVLSHKSACCRVARAHPAAAVGALGFGLGLPNDGHIADEHDDFPDTSRETANVSEIRR